MIQDKDLSERTDGQRAEETGKDTETPNCVLIFDEEDRFRVYPDRTDRHFTALSKPLCASEGEAPDTDTDALFKELSLSALLERINAICEATDADGEGNPLRENTRAWKDKSDENEDDADADRHPQS